MPRGDGPTGDRRARMPADQSQPPCRPPRRPPCTSRSLGIPAAGRGGAGRLARRRADRTRGGGRDGGTAAVRGALRPVVTGGVGIGSTWSWGATERSTSAPTSATSVGLRPDAYDRFAWPTVHPLAPPTVGECLLAMMASRGWEGAEAWSRGASSTAPTLVGGSKRHGGPDLGPTRAKQQWAGLGVDGLGVADAPPQPGFTGVPRLTVAMAARLQGFPDDWRFSGRKTAAYKQVGNAFPPPVARAVGVQILKALAIPVPAR